MTPGAVREKCRRIGIRRTRHRTKSLGQDEALAELEMLAKVIREREIRPSVLAETTRLRASASVAW
jgi:hypothetical protein